MKIKPKIHIDGGWWVCSCAGYIGYGIGATPVIAFENWSLGRWDYKL